MKSRYVKHTRAEKMALKRKKQRDSPCKQRRRAKREKLQRVATSIVDAIEAQIAEAQEEQA